MEEIKMNTKNYFLQETYNAIKKVQILKDYTIKIKDQFLNEELWKKSIDSLDKELKVLKDKIKDYQ